MLGNGEGTGTVVFVKASGDQGHGVDGLLQPWPYRHACALGNQRVHEIAHQGVIALDVSNDAPLIVDVPVLAVKQCVDPNGT